MAIFNSYVKLLEGKYRLCWLKKHMTQAFLEIIGSGTSESHGFLFQKRNRFGILSMPCWGVRFSNIESHGFVMFKWCIPKSKKMCCYFSWQLPCSGVSLPRHWPVFFTFLAARSPSHFGLRSTQEPVKGKGIDLHGNMMINDEVS